MPDRVATVGDREISRFTFRIGLFKRRGYEADRAERTADALRERDRLRDDRRMCIECTHLQRSGGCFQAAQGKLLWPADKRLQPVTDVLQRCERFEFAKPS